MANRISKRLVKFSTAFSIRGVDGEWPAGSYTIVTEEEPIAAISLSGFRRIATTMVSYPPKGTRGATQYIDVEPQDLENALAQDAAAAALAKKEET